MHYVDWSGGNGQPGHLLYDPFEEEALLFAHGSHHICPEMKKALQGVFLIAEQKKRIEESTKVSTQLQWVKIRSLGNTVTKFTMQKINSLEKADPMQNFVIDMTSQLFQLF